MNRRINHDYKEDRNFAASSQSPRTESSPRSPRTESSPRSPRTESSPRSPRTTTSSQSFLFNPQKFTPFGELATPQSRLIALLIDALIFGLGFGVVWIIWFITLADKGSTPGHHLMGQVVVDAETGIPFGWKKMVVREILIKGVLHWILGGFLFMANYIVDGAFILTSRQRTVHDMMVGSQVIQRSDKTIIRKLKVDEVDEWLNK
jgi:uncharacterized RDD family membrane protein YckC